MSASPSHALPSVAGIGLRQAHMADMIERRPGVGWLEVHAENLMQEGPATTTVERLRGHYPLSVHGVGLSIGTSTGIDQAHLARLKTVVDRYEPAMVSEHLAWSVGDGIYLNDLLPVPHDEEALAIVAANIEQVQDALRCPILIENLSAYVGFACSTMDEPEFLAELARRTGCGLLLDVNNVVVSAYNLGFDPGAYIAKLPGHAIAEIHLAGHASNDTPDGPVLIDDHGSRVPAQVWSLYSATIGLVGQRPTLIEWDSALPPLDVLVGEAMHADMLVACLAFQSAVRAGRPSLAVAPTQGVALQFAAA